MFIGRENRALVFANNLYRPTISKVWLEMKMGQAINLNRTTVANGGEKKIVFS